MDLVVGTLAIAGGALVLLAGVGVLRFDDLYSRMHAATKAPTLGSLLIGLAAIISVDESRPKLALAVILIFVTAPVAAHMVTRAAYRAEDIEVRLEAGDDLAALVEADAASQDGDHPG